MKATSRMALLMFLSLTMLVLIGFAEAEKWTKKTDMRTEKMFASSAVVDGKIYIIGGSADFITEASDTVREYDPVNDKWRTRAALPTSRVGLSAIAVNGKIYAIGGAPSYDYGSGTFSGLSIVEVYDPATNEWTRKSDLPTPRLWLTTSVVNGKIYAIGGCKKSPTPTAAVEEYDPVTDTWTRKSSMSTSRYWLGSSVVNGIIYAIGGYDINPLKSVEAYDPVTDNWTMKRGLPDVRMGLCTSTVGGKIYAVGGAADWNSSPREKSMKQYDPLTDRWVSKEDMLIGMRFFASSVVNGKIYAIGGQEKEDGPGLKVVEEYDTGLRD